MIINDARDIFIPPNLAGVSTNERQSLPKSATLKF